MDVNECLILVKQGGEMIDKTSSIESIIRNGNKYIISYSNSQKEYGYNTDNILYCQRPRRIDLTGLVVRIKGASPAKWDAAIAFDSYVRLFHGPNTRLEKLADIELLDDLTQGEETKHIISYYFELARLVEEANPKLGYLSKYYKEKLGHLQPESVASKFVTAGDLKGSKFSNMPLFPFGVNPSQRQAVINALENQVSLIQGPPGTGKTQTILNIITNLVVQGKSVAVVAGNNSAVANVYEKLQKEGVGFIAASLGNSALQKEFFDSDNRLPELSKWRLSNEEKIARELELKDVSSDITQLLEDNNRLALVKESYSRLQIEREYFNKHFDILPIDMKRSSFFHKWNAPHLLNFMADFKHQSQYGKLSFLTKFKWLYRYGIYKFSDFKSLSNDVFKGVISEYYETKSSDLAGEIEFLESVLAQNDFDSMLEKLTESSLIIFKNFIADKYRSQRNVEFTKGSYKQNFDAFLRRFPVVLSTTDSIINNKGQAELFDYLIVDEASQVNLLTGFLTMSCAKNIIVVGDLQQIPHIPDRSIDNSVDDKFHISAGYSYFEESLLSSLVQLFPSVSSTLLKEHYRCHPRIIDFCNQKYYNGQLIVMTKGKEDPFKIIKTGSGNHARTPLEGSGYVNVRELDVIKNEILGEELERSTANNVGIISPYRAQANEALKRIAENELVADTVHKFQGREKECIIFSTAANNLTEYMDNPNLLNVAVSRAQNRFVMVTSPKVLKKQGSNIGDLLRHIEYQTLDPCILESKTISIFDCLYQEYSAALEIFRSKVSNKSDYLSENLMITLIDEILEQKIYNSFSYQCDYPLHLLVNDFSMFDQEQRKFASNPHSHIDFLFYNKLDMQPVLAIEVDGYRNHVLDEKQRTRDKQKNSILEKLSIPLLRLSTTESSEKERVISALNRLMGIH